MSSNEKKLWPHKWYGFFHLPGIQGCEEAPDLSDYIDEDWNIPDLEKILPYLRDNKNNIMRSLSPPFQCKFCDNYAGDPVSYFYDGTYLWTEILIHYIQDHHITLPDDFVTHIRNRNYQPNPDANDNPKYLPWPPWLTYMRDL